MKENPLRTLRLKFLNIVYLFHPRIVPFYPMDKDTKLIFGNQGRISLQNIVSRRPAEEWAHTVIYSFIFLTSLVGFYLRRKKVSEDRILYFIIFTFVGICSIYWPATRLRSPMDFVLIFYSACAVSPWVGRVIDWAGSLPFSAWTGASRKNL